MRSPGLVHENLGNHKGKGCENTPGEREKTGVVQHCDELVARGAGEDRQAHTDRPGERASRRAVARWFIPVLRAGEKGRTSRGYARAGRAAAWGRKWIRPLDCPSCSNV